MADETSIKVGVATRDRLNILAAERNTTVRALVEKLAQETLTSAEREQRATEARDYLRKATGSSVTPDMEAAGKALLGRVTERRAGHTAAGGSAA
ncbi:hypothetical protein [Streptacidiphilus anmyonensis]|uniref:hypothetical protein n=1 Tax=Streptacidiphilus anmyonensis TaxID=405782 RepID=UPI0005A6BEBE|nr:hypothetical protein [Streptacidiphilus anmyonensis]